MKFHKIFLAEGNPQVKKEITELFIRRGDIKILGEATSAQELYANEKVYGADIVLLDLHLQQEPFNGLIKHILYRNHRIDVIALQENDFL